MSLLGLLLILLVVAIAFGGFGHTRGGWGYYSWSPVGLILLVLLLLWATGRL